MDEVDCSLNKAISYLSVIRSSCDNMRAFLEKSFNAEYQQFVKEWKTSQEKEEEKLNCEKEEFFQDISEILQLEEMVLADNLLQKARRIRETFKTPSLTESETSKGSKENVSTAIDICQKEKVPNKLLLGKKMKQSQSMPSINSSKNYVTHSSKLRQHSKDFNRTRGTLPREKKASISNHFGATVIPQSQLSNYQNISKKHSLRKDIPSTKVKPPTLNNCDEKHCGTKHILKTHLPIVPVKFSSYSTLEKHCPTYRDFLNYTHSCQRPLKLNFQQSIWYPYLEPSTTSCLIGTIKCQNVEELRELYILLHQIQEIAFLFDFFHILGEVISNLNHLNKHSREFSVISSYILSIFHPKLRRKPVIVSSNKFKSG